MVNNIKGGITMKLGGSVGNVPQKLKKLDIKLHIFRYVSHFLRVKFYTKVKHFQSRIRTLSMTLIITQLKGTQIYSRLTRPSSGV
jgi:hypothetical protein